MISPDQEAMVERMLAAGDITRQRIARLTDVSYWTVYDIATGKRSATLSRDKPKRDTHRPGKIVPPSGPYRKCPQCGEKVKQPCLACQLRKKCG